MNEITRISAGSGVPLPFDYSTLTDEPAAVLRGVADRVRRRHAQQIMAIIETGQDLIKAKGLVGHGQFGAWLACEFRWDERTARNYIAVAERLGSKTEIVSDLQPTALYALASPTAPAGARADILSRLEAGEHMTSLSVKTIIKTARDADAAQRRDNRRSAEQRTSDEQRQTRRATALAQDKADRDRQAKDAETAAGSAVSLVLEHLGEPLSRDLIALLQGLAAYHFVPALKRRLNTTAANPAPSIAGEPEDHRAAILPDER